jgi:hypothetical protein
MVGFAGDTTNLFDHRLHRFEPFHGRLDHMEQDTSTGPSKRRGGR